MVTLWRSVQKEKLGEKLGEKLSNTELLLLKEISFNYKVSQKKLASLLGISTTTVEKNIRNLKDKGFLERSGPAKGGHWVVYLKE